MSALARLIGPQVLEALGMATARCARFSIHFEPNEVVRVEAEYYPDDIALQDVIKIVRTLKPSE